MSRLAVFRQVYTMELRRLFTYRLNFWLHFFGMLFANIAIAYFLWEAIFRQSGSSVIQGFTFPGIVLYYVLVPLIENITRSSTDGGTIAWEIYEGTLTRYLVYPVSFFAFRYASTLASASMAIAQLLILLGGYALIVGLPTELSITPASMALGLGAALFASVVNFFMVSIVEMVAFWADNVWSLNVMLMFTARLLGGALLPLSMFPAKAQVVLEYTPFPYLASFPILTMVGKVEMTAWTKGLWVMAIWLMIFAGVNAVVWRRGNLKYTGVGV